MVSGMRKAVPIALSLATAATFAAPGPAAAAPKYDPCGRPGQVCMWTQENYQGSLFTYSASQGYVDVPADWHDNVASFYSDGSGCFVNYESDGTKETRAISPGDYNVVYKRGFGGYVDALQPSC